MAKEIPIDNSVKPWGNGDVYIVRVVTDLTHDEVHKIIEEALPKADSAILEVEVEGVWE